MCLEHLECLHDEVTKVLSLALAVVDGITLVQVLGLEQVHDWQDLTVVWHKGLTDGITALDKRLQDVESSGNNLGITGVECRLDGNDELRDDGEDLGLAVSEQIEDTLDSKESVWVLLFTDSLHEDGEVVMVVELVHLNLPCNLVGRAVLNLDGQISTIVEAAELARRDLSLLVGAGLGGQDGRLGFGLVQGADFATATLTLLGIVHLSGSVGNRLFLGGKRLWLKDWSSLLWHVRRREVTESRVLWLREELVVRNLEWLGTSSVKNVLEVILEDH